VHVVVGAVTAAATLAAPFFLAARMRRVDGWRDLARPAFLFGWALLVLLLGYAALEGKTGGGHLQPAAIVLLSGGVVALALRVVALARTHVVDATGGLSSSPARHDAPPIDGGVMHSGGR
jgi:hypothetical protein